jgi:hypothetical protein
MRTYDLIKKYGWTMLPFLSNIGIKLAWNGNVFFVDNEHSDALNAVGKETGNSWTNPFSTLNYAISQCTSGQGDIILVAPNHAETIQDTGTASGATTDELVVDKTDITIVGLGTGLSRPTFTLSGATDAAMVVVAGATNVTVKNLRFVSDLADVAAGITLSATSDGFTIENCEFRDGGATKELVYGINIAADCDDVTIRNCVFHTTDTGSSTLSAIFMAGGCDRAIIEDNVFIGDWNTNGVIDNATAASTDMTIRRNHFDQLDAATGKAVVLHASCTGIFANNYAHGGNDGTSPWTVAGMCPFENYVTNAEGASGILSPGADS